jgi:hypothetical protein
MDARTRTHGPARLLVAECHHEKVGGKPFFSDHVIVPSKKKKSADKGRAQKELECGFSPWAIGAKVRERRCRIAFWKGGSGSFVVSSFRDHGRITGTCRRKTPKGRNHGGKARTSAPPNKARKRRHHHQ